MITNRATTRTNGKGSTLRWIGYATLLTAAFSQGNCTPATLPPDAKTAFPAHQPCPNTYPDDAIVRVDHLGSADPQYLRIRPEVIVYLSRARAVPLWCGGASDEVYRLTWIPSYRSAVVLELTQSNGAWGIESWVFGDPRKSDRDAPTSEVVRHGDARLTAEQGASWLDLIGDARFWTTPSWRRNEGLTDGVVWLLEGRRAGGYRVVGRYTPSHEWEPHTRLLLRQMFALAEVDVPEPLLDQ